MKKILALAIAIVMIVGSISACDADIEESDASKSYSDSNSQSMIQNENGNIEENDASNEELDSKTDENSNTVDLDDVWSVGRYSNGLMLVSVQKGTGYSYFFINKEGERVLDFPDGFIYPSIDYFIGKYFIVIKVDNDSKKSVKALMDKTGKVIFPSDVNVTGFVLDQFNASLEMLADGYILAKTIKDSYLEVETPLCVFDNDFNKLVDLSGIIEIADLDGYKYLPGFLYNEDKAVDVRTGKVYTNLADMYKQIDFKHDSDWWNSTDKGYYDIRDPEEKIVLSEEKFPDTKYLSYDFSDGLCPITFCVRSDNNTPYYYFSIIDEKGDMLFEPVKLFGDAVNDFEYCNGFYAISTNYNLYVFDKTGKIAEIKCEEEDYPVSTSLSFSDDVIVFSWNLTLFDHITRVYTPDLKPLF